MPSLVEMLTAFYGVYRFARGDRGAKAWFNLTPQGFWNSFFAAILVLPAHMAFLAIAPEGTDAFDSVDRGLAHLTGYAVSWLAYPLAFWYVLGLFGRHDRFLTYIIPYNWASVPIAYLVLFGAAAALSGVLPGGLGALLSTLAYGASFVLLWLLARLAAGFSMPFAAAVVLFDVVFSIMVQNLLDLVSGV